MNEKYDDLSKDLFVLKESNRALAEMQKENNKVIEQLQFDLMNMLDEDGLEKCTTKYGSLTRKSTMYPSINEETGGFNAFVDWVSKTDSYEFIQRRPNPKPVREYFLANNDYPPGIETYVKDSVLTRINSGFRQQLNSE